jgi:hypothetical protein
MRGICPLLVVLLLMASCASPPKLPRINQTLPSVADTNCTAPFPDGRWEFVHSIEATMPQGKNAVLIGITVLSSQTGSIHSVLMTLEGLVLFDAQYDDRVVINRGIPPFDSMDFARGLINDIILMFFPPDGQLLKSGIFADGSWVCRYKTNDNKVVDVITTGNGSWEIREYSDDFALTRSVRAYPDPQGNGEKQKSVPGKLVLTVYGPSEYSLTLELIEARGSRN